MMAFVEVVVLLLCEEIAKMYLVGLVY
jgi:hypothetical protein